MVIPVKMASVKMRIMFKMMTRTMFIFVTTCLNDSAYIRDMMKQLKSWKNEDFRCLNYFSQNWSMWGSRMFAVMNWMLST